MVRTYWLLNSTHPPRSLPVMNPVIDQCSPSSKRRLYKNGHWRRTAESSSVNEGFLATPEVKPRRKNKIGFDDRLYGARELPKIIA